MAKSKRILADLRRRLTSRRDNFLKLMKSEADNGRYDDALEDQIRVNELNFVLKNLGDE